MWDVGEVVNEIKWIQEWEGRLSPHRHLSSSTLAPLRSLGFSLTRSSLHHEKWSEDVTGYILSSFLSVTKRGNTWNIYTLQYSITIARITDVMENTLQRQRPVCLITMKSPLNGYFFFFFSLFLLSSSSVASKVIKGENFWLINTFISLVFISFLFNLLLFGLSGDSCSSLILS